MRAHGYSVTLPALDGDPATINQNATLDAALLAQWQVSHIVSAFPISNPDLTLLSVVDHVYIYANQRYQPDPGVVWNVRKSVTVPAARATNNGMAGILPSLQGWQRIAPPDTAEAAIPETVRYTYAPSEQSVGIGISAAALIGIGGAMIPSRRKRAV